MKILILGASGMAGHMVTIYLQEKGYDVLSVSRKKLSYCEGIVCDIAETNVIKEYILKNDFQIIINCIGLLNETCDNQISQAVLLNSFLPHFLADITKGSNTKIIHLSTDCVFSGNTGKYNENDMPDGISYYDRTKALGEINDSYNLTFRNSIIGPDINENGIGLFNWFMKQKSEIYGYTNVIWNGVTTLVLAQAIEQVIRENLCGIYHLISRENISKYNLLLLFNKYLKNSKINIIEKEDVYLDKSLVNNRKDFSFRVPNYENMVREMKLWIETHNTLYPHYRIEG